MIKRVLVGIAVAMGVSSAAFAGESNEVIDYLQVTPIMGGETTHIGIGGVMTAADGTAMFKSGEFTFTGMTYGGVVGFRLAPVSLGLLYQRTDAESPSGAAFDVNRLYGELGINAQYGKWLLLAHFDFGYAFVLWNNQTVQGFGGKVGLALDYYPIQLISVGGGAAFDAVGYSITDGLAGGFGGTFVARVGLHL